MAYNKKRGADTQEDAWVAAEDTFVLQQAKKKAAIRVKEGRARPIDWLAVTLRFIDPARDPFDDEVLDTDLDIVDPEGVLEGLDETQLRELEKDIDVYASLEKNKTNLEFWNTMAVICGDRRQKFRPEQRGRGQDSVNAEVDRLFGSKSIDQLNALDKQIRTKLRSNEPIDVEYWEGLLKSLISWKARVQMRQVSQSIVESQLQGLRTQQGEDAVKVQEKLQDMLKGRRHTDPDVTDMKRVTQHLDPEALLKARTEDKSLPLQDEADFLSRIVSPSTLHSVGCFTHVSQAAERRKVLKLGFVPMKRHKGDMSTKPAEAERAIAKVSTSQNDEFSQATTALYEREVARGVGENEEIFAGEEEVSTNKPNWANKYRPRKPRYFNRVQMGYEWNKYNQTHYDHDNPPPKVVQGYKFNIFYPDLIDKTKAPTYKIEREGGRRRGESFAPAGEEDTCLIRFLAGPPYEDLAFRIVDKEWDYSAKRERGFKSSFDKGILQLHFQFKKIFYRK